MSASSDTALQTPPRVAECCERVRAFLGERNIAAAAQAFDEGCEEHPGMALTAEGQLLKGRIARWRERYKEARRCFRLAARDARFAVECRYEIGRVWLEAERTELAVEALLAVAQDETALIPWRAHAWSGLCVAFSALEREASAEEAIKRAASFGLISAQLLTDEAYHLVVAGSIEEAQGQLARAIQIDLGCVDAFVMLANLFHIRGRAKEAKEILAYGIEQSPHAIKLFALMAEIHFSRGEYREAAAFYRRTLELSPDGANTDANRLCFARCCYRAGHPKQTVVELKALLARHSKSAYRRDARELLTNLGEGGRAFHTIEKFPRELQQRNYCGPNTLANVLTYLGRKTDQREVAEQVFTQGARWHDIVTYLRELPGFQTFAFLANIDQVKRIIDADIPVITGEYTGVDGHAVAIIGYDDRLGVVAEQDPLFFDPVDVTYQQFKRSWAFTDGLAVVVVPDNKAAVIKDMEREGEELVDRWLGALHLRAEGKFDDAAQALAAILKDEPAYSSARRTLVEIAIITQEYERALDLLNDELERDPHSYWALRYSGDIALTSGEAAAAMDFYGRAVRVFPDDPTLHYARGEIALSAGDRKRGRAELVKALEEHPSAIHPRIRLARDYLESDDGRLAAYHAAAVLELSPKHKDATAILSRARALMKEADSK